MTIRTQNVLFHDAGKTYPPIVNQKSWEKAKEKARRPIPEVINVRSLAGWREDEGTGFVRVIDHSKDVVGRGVEESVPGASARTIAEGRCAWRVTP